MSPDRVRAGGMERDVAFEAAGPRHCRGHPAYHAKYGRYGTQIVQSFTRPIADRLGGAL